MSLTVEDKEWFVTEVMGAVQRRFDVEREFSSQANDHLLQRVSGVEGRLQGVEDRLQGVEDRLQSVEGRVTVMQEQLNAVPAAIERVETSLLTEFHKWSSPLEARMRTHSAALRALDLEMEFLADRITRLEPPH
jgi:chromosome segregation ATPase